MVTSHTFDVPGMPADYTVGRQSLDDTEAVLAVVHAYDIATLGYPDFVSSDVVDVYNGSHTDPERDTWVVRDDSGTIYAWAFIASNYGGDKDDVNTDPASAAGEARVGLPRGRDEYLEPRAGPCGRFAISVARRLDRRSPQLDPAAVGSRAGISDPRSTVAGSVLT